MVTCYFVYDLYTKRIILCRTSNLGTGIGAHCTMRLAHLESRNWYRRIRDKKNPRRSGDLSGLVGGLLGFAIRSDAVYIHCVRQSFQQGLHRLAFSDYCLLAYIECR